jgi:hypothetical protein
MMRPFKQPFAGLILVLFLIFFSDCRKCRLPSALANEPQLQLRIYDGTGHLVIEQQLVMDEERPRMDVWDVAPGFYMVAVSNGKRTYSGNMVVE